MFLMCLLVFSVYIECMDKYPIPRFRYLHGRQPELLVKRATALVIMRLCILKFSIDPEGSYLGKQDQDESETIQRYLLSSHWHRQAITIPYSIGLMAV